MKYLGIFILVILLSYAAFSWLNTQLVPEAIVPTMQAPEPEIASPSKESVPDLTLAVEEEVIDIDTSMYKRDAKGFYDINWKNLSKVIFNEVFVDSLDSYVPFPVFHPEIKYLDGKNIQIKGYVIPIEETGDETILVLSANPYSSCFFCGGAGPETVMDIKLKKKTTKRLKQDNVTTFRGKLRLNDSDLYYLNYILEGAELVK